MKIEEVRAAAEAQEKATPGPWHQDFDLADEEGILPEPEPTSSILDRDGGLAAMSHEQANIDFITAARSLSLTKIADALEAAQRLITELKPSGNFAFICGLEEDINEAHGALVAALASLEAKP